MLLLKARKFIRPTSLLSSKYTSKAIGKAQAGVEESFVKAQEQRKKIEALLPNPSIVEVNGQFLDPFRDIDPGLFGELLKQVEVMGIQDRGKGKDKGEDKGEGKFV